MAINWMDNFNIYGTDAGRAARLLNGVYAETTRADLQADPDPTATGQVLRKYGGGLGGDLRWVLPTARTTLGALGRFWLSNLPISVGETECPTLFSFRDTNNNSHIQITIDPSGNIIANRVGNGSTRTQIAITATPVLVANAWKHVETKVVIDAAAGSVQVKVEGITVLTVSGVKTTSDITGAGMTCQQVAQQSCQDASGPILYMKDYIIWDSTGAFNNDFMGSCQVLKIIPDADVSLNWAPSAGATGYNLINEVTPDDDGTYISASAILPTPTNGALSATAGGALGAVTYYVRSTFVNATGETLGATETSLAVAANNVLNVAAPASQPLGATGWNVYVSTAAGTETKQNGGVPISLAAAWVEPTTGLVAGAALPGANTTTIPAAYKCSLSDLPITVTSVRGVMPIHRSRKTDGGDGNIQSGLVSAGSTGLGSNRPITTAYTYWWDVFDADPNGSIAWTRLSVNALNLQLNRTV